MNRIEEIYELSTGVPIEGIKGGKKEDYVCELRKLNPSAEELKSMLVNTSRRIQYYKSPEAKRAGMRNYIEVGLIGVIICDILCGIVVVSGMVMAAMSLKTIVGTIVGMVVASLLMFCVIVSARSIDLEREIRETVEDLEVVRLAIMAYSSRKL